MTQPAQIKDAVEKTIREFGGLDIVVSNAGTFPASQRIDKLEAESWQQIIEVNLNSHQYLMHECIPYLELRIDPAVIVIASKMFVCLVGCCRLFFSQRPGSHNWHALPLSNSAIGIRVNVIHPNAVFDTGIWTDDVLKNRAANYKMSVQEYKTNNILHVEISSKTSQD